jgi:hypothetical protein
MKNYEKYVYYILLLISICTLSIAVVTRLILVL